MALIPCEDCGSQISERAWKCPQCGLVNVHQKILHPRYYDENGNLKILKLLLPLSIPLFILIIVVSGQ